MTRQHLAIIVVGVTTVLMPVAFARVLAPAFRDCMRQVTDTYQSALLNAQKVYDDEIESAMEERKQGHIDSWNNDDDKVQRQVQRDADKRFSSRISAARKTQRDRNREANKTNSDEQRTCKSNSSSSSSRSSSSYSSRSSSSPGNQTCGGEDTYCAPGSHCGCTGTNTCPINSYCIPSCIPGCVPNNQPPPPPPPTVRQWCFGDSQCSTGYRCEMGNGICERPCDSPYDPCPAVCAGRCVLRPTW